MSSVGNPAAQLEGMTLDGEWVVEKRLTPSPAATGGNFSFGYTARHPRHGVGFLKALDYSRALRAPDAARALQAMTEAFNYERSLLEKCGTANLSRVVKALAYGQVDVPGHSIPVSYLVFENADADVREHLAASATLDDAWALRALHHVAVGLRQLHMRKIAHQDLKPSNVLVFEGGDSSKIADLGRGEYQGEDAPWSGLPVAGDPGYAPLEQLYGHVESDWRARRQACDLYHLGSMVLFFFADAGTTAAVLAKLPPDQHPQNWPNDYAAVLPFVRDAFDLVATELEQRLAVRCAAELASMFRELCDPDPTLRGHPKARGRRGNPYSLERYVSKFDLLARRAENRLIRVTST